MAARETAPDTASWGTFVSRFAPVGTGTKGTIFVIGVNVRV